MPEIPKILIIDDQFGNSLRDRRNLCALFSLKDNTGDDKSPEPIKDPVADAVFCSGQIHSDNKVKNSVSLTLDFIKKGWPSPEEWRWTLILLDLRFASGEVGLDGEPTGRDEDDLFGLEVLDNIHRSFSDIPVIIMSSKERSDVIEECRKKGASDFIQRVGYGFSELAPKEVLIQKISDHGLVEDRRNLTNEKIRIVGQSVSIMKALRDARRAATGKGNILILGETGTGKELFARYIHDVSPRADGPYRVFHPFGAAETLQEDELFGHEKGTFTGAITSKQGIFEATNGGTLLIDEIGDIPENLQNRLLRPIESRQVARQGGNNEIPLDIQLILATNKNLDDYVDTGRFKTDLLNRIKAYTITLPPLRERKEDIPLLSYHLLEMLCKENNARWPRKILPETMQLLENYNWPDNIRELRNVLERVVKNSRDSEIVVSSDIQFDSLQKLQMTNSSENPLTQDVEEEFSLDDLVKKMSVVEFPKEYAKLQGKLPDIQMETARLFSRYLLSAIEVTKKTRPGMIEGELNLTGAASCLVGKQLTTIQAADLVKRLLKMNEETFEAVIKEYPILDQAYQEALKLRPHRPKKR